jgi:hypothetical protein
MGEISDRNGWGFFDPATQARWESDELAARDLVSQAARIGLSAQDIIDAAPQGVAPVTYAGPTGPTNALPVGVALAVVRVFLPSQWAALPAVAVGDSSYTSG